MKLHWPEQVAISPLEGSLYFIDDHMLLRLTHDRRIMIVAGQPHYCRKAKRQNSGSSFTNFAFGPTGNLTFYFNNFINILIFRNSLCR